MTIKKIGDDSNINSVNPLYFIINEMIGHFKGKNENKYLVLNKYEDVWEGIKKEIETINSYKKIEYGKHF